MLKNNNLQTAGFSSIVMLAIAIGIIALTLFLYYGFQSNIDYENIWTRNFTNQDQNVEPTGPEEVNEDVSALDDEATLDAELESTVVSSPDKDFVELEEQASQL